MLTYLNEFIERVPVENKDDIKKWYEINEKMYKLDKDTFRAYLEIIGNYTWDGGVSNANKCRAIAKKLNCTIYELSMWYVIED